MSSRRFVRGAGLAGVVGGLLWVISTAIHASRPVGCVGAECAGRAMREAGAVEGVLALAALVLFAVAAAALITLVRRAGRFGTLGMTGTVLAGTGVGLLITGGLIQELLYDGDLPFMPFFVGPGVVALTVGLVLLAVTVLRSGVLPGWAGGALVIGALSLLLSNEQTATAWLAVPLGLAWVAVGIALWQERTRTGSSY